MKKEGIPRGKILIRKLHFPRAEFMEDAHKVPNKALGLCEE